MGAASTTARLTIRESSSQGSSTSTALGSAGAHYAHLSEAGFGETTSPAGFCPLWRSFSSQDNGPVGYYHVLCPDERWSVTIHDFTLPQDTVLDFTLSDYLSVTWFKSVSGEEFCPYRKLRSNSIWGFCSDERDWRGFVHGEIPVRSIAIEVRPELYREYLVREYDGQFERVRDAYRSLNYGGDFPEMRLLLSSFWPKPGDEHRSKLYYEGKVFEALGLIVERTNSQPAVQRRRVSKEDCLQIQSVVSYIDDHCSRTLRVADLAQAACMSPTKFKECFKAVTGSTLTQNVQLRRMNLAESLLQQPDLSVEQIARAVGYTCTSRFSELFRREIGLLPSEYRAQLR